MKFVTLDAPPSGRAAILLGDEVFDFARAPELDPLAGWIPTSVAGILAGGDEGLEIARRVVGRVEAASEDQRNDLRARRVLAPLAERQLLAPLPHPGILVSHGRAYLSHLEEMQKTDTPQVEDNPSGFIKNNNSIIGPGAPIILPPQCPDMVDFEGEFSIVFGSYCHNVDAEDAMDHVAGYTIVNDVSARDWVHTFHETRDPELNRMGKQLPGFSPMGPVVVTRDEIADPHDLELTTTLNGEIMQQASTDGLIWRIPELISFFSRWYPFGPGNILTTGSPPGVGFGRDPKLFMQAGDTIAITVTGIGTLSNPVVAA